MNEYIKRIMGHISNLWKKWSIVQRVILIGIVVLAIGGIIALLSVSSSPSLVPVINIPIKDPVALDRVVMRINQEHEKAYVNAAGLVQVADEATARRMRMILMSENLIPTGTDPWNLFDRERWTITDFERNINLQRAIKQTIADHIKALDDVDNAVVEITFPADRLFVSEQNEVTASVTIFPKPNSDITENRKKIEGIQKILKFSVEGLKDENIVITDQSGLVLNDFGGIMKDFDRQTLIEREQKFIQLQEAKYRALVLSALQQTFTPERVRDLSIKIDMDMSKKAVSTEENLPTVLKDRTPGSPFDDSIIVPSITIGESISSTKWEGTGINPEGPTGVEGQTPPAFKDMTSVFGKMTQDTNVHNEKIGSRVTQEERSPQHNRVTVSVNIDGTWEWKYDEKGKPVLRNGNGSIEREYTPIPPEVIRATQTWIENAVGYNAARSDSVTVHNIPFDRTKEFSEEDAAYFRKKQTQMTIVVFLFGLTVLLIGFIIFRVVAREMERRRRLAEEERARREQALRESAMMEAEQEGMEVSISMEERARMELMESVTNLAKEHPEDCAQLIRTWLLEE